MSENASYPITNVDLAHDMANAEAPHMDQYLSKRDQADKMYKTTVYLDGGPQNTRGVYMGAHLEEESSEHYSDAQKASEQIRASNESMQDPTAKRIGNKVVSGLSHIEMIRASNGQNR